MYVRINDLKIFIIISLRVSWRLVLCHFFYVQSWMAESPEIEMSTPGYIQGEVSLLLEVITDRHKKIYDQRTDRWTTDTEMG